MIAVIFKLPPQTETARSAFLSQEEYAINVWILQVRQVLLPDQLHTFEAFQIPSRVIHLPQKFLVAAVVHLRNLGRVIFRSPDIAFGATMYFLHDPGKVPWRDVD